MSCHHCILVHGGSLDVFVKVFYVIGKALSGELHVFCTVCTATVLVFQITYIKRNVVFAYDMVVSLESVFQVSHHTVKECSFK